jgi:tetratricopeptide (TPR) repeat protein
MRTLTLIALALVFSALVSSASADDKTECATSEDQERVIASCTAVIVAAADDPETRAIALTNRGSARQKLKNYDAAIADLDEAIRLNPKLSRAYFNRGTVYYRKNDAKHAMADFNEAVRLDPMDLEALVNRAVLSFDLDDNARAISDMDAAIKLAPKNTMLYAYRAKMYLDSGDAKRAGADFKRVLELDPSNAEARAMLRDLGMETK